jgi:hypothetical protein
VAADALSALASYSGIAPIYLSAAEINSYSPDIGRSVDANHAISGSSLPIKVVI